MVDPENRPDNERGGEPEPESGPGTGSGFDASQAEAGGEPESGSPSPPEPELPEPEPRPKPEHPYESTSRPEPEHPYEPASPPEPEHPYEPAARSEPGHPYEPASGPEPEHPFGPAGGPEPERPYERFTASPQVPEPPRVASEPPPAVSPEASDGEKQGLLSRVLAGRKTLLIVIVVLVLILAGGGAYLFLRTKGSPRQTAGDFLDAWQKNDIAAMKTRVDHPPADFTAAYRRLRTDLGVKSLTTKLGKVTESGGTSHAAFTATLALNALGHWTYHGRLDLIKADHVWKIKWSPSAIYPGMTTGQHLAVATRWPHRGAILAADGSRLDAPGATGSVQMLTGTVLAATKKDVARLGAPYEVGDPVGAGGIQQRYETRLAGKPTAVIRIVDAKDHPVRAVGHIAGHPGASVRTSLSPKVQAAAAQAIISQTKPTALVAIRPSTGEILAVANVPGGFNRALDGHYPPGSTFKMVTAEALAKAGVTPDTTVQCPKKIDVGGLVVHNAEGEHFGAISFRKAFAQSCNTAFAGTTQQKLNGAELKSAARLFGFDAPIDIGLPTQRGHFPAVKDDAALAAASFGQGNVTANPLQMATVAGAIADGTWRPPHLVSSPTVHQKVSAHKLPADVDAQLKSMMREVITSGTAKGKGLPSGTMGKTGTAEYGTGPKPPAHAWFAAARGDVAMAVIVEGGGFGAKAAAPISANFFKSLG